MLKVHHASLTYTDRFIFEDLDFEVPQGQWLAIMGESGVGKTSLLRLIAGLHQTHPEHDTQITGECTWQNQACYDIAYMAAEDGLFPWLSVLDNVRLPFLLRKKAEPLSAIDLLKAVKLLESQSFKPAQLSSGMRQRTALARTLIQQTDLVLMDEPFSALDAMTRMQMQALSFELLHQSNKTIVMVTHDPNEALRLADSILILKGSPAKITAKIDLPSTIGIRDITSPDMIKHYHQLMHFFNTESAEAPAPSNRSKGDRR